MSRSRPTSHRMTAIEALARDIGGRVPQYGPGTAYRAAACLVGRFGIRSDFESIVRRAPDGYLRAIDRLGPVTLRALRDAYGTPTAPTASPASGSWAEFRTRGLLWLVNAAVFHPRGFALAFEYPPGTTDPDHTEPVGWQILGDGKEPWYFDPTARPDGYVDRLFAAVEALLAEAAAAGR